MLKSEEIKMQQFFTISQQMLALAEKNQWEQMAALESERKQLMTAFFENQLSEMPAAKLSQLIQDVLLINEKIEHRAEQEKETIGQNLYALKQKQNVHSAYLQNK